MLKGLRIVFSNWRYIILSGLTFAFAFGFAVWLPNLDLILSIFSDPRVSTFDKITLPINLLGAIATNFSLLSASNTVVGALLIGINVSLIIHNWKLKSLGFVGTGGLIGSLGVLSGILGIGCAACGSLVLMSTLGTFAGAIAFLPLRGGEFGIAGVILLAFATYLQAKQIGKPLVCKLS